MFLRRILRRGVVNGRLLGYKEPIICKLVPTVIDIMGEYFTELRASRTISRRVIRSEEERCGDCWTRDWNCWPSRKEGQGLGFPRFIPGEDISTVRHSMVSVDHDATDGR